MEEAVSHRSRRLTRVSHRMLNLYVMAETDAEGGFSDNVVDILPCETATLVFTPDDPARIDEAWQSLVIRDLYSSSLSTKG